MAKKDVLGNGITVGAGLPAMAADQSMKRLTVVPPSRASPLPQGKEYTWEVRTKRQSPHKAGFGLSRWPVLVSGLQGFSGLSHQAMCSGASHGIRAGSQRGDLSNRVPFGTRPTCPCHPLAHQSASSPTSARLAHTRSREGRSLDRFDSSSCITRQKTRVAGSR